MPRQAKEEDCLDFCMIKVLIGLFVRFVFVCLFVFGFFCLFVFLSLGPNLGRGPVGPR